MSACYKRSKLDNRTWHLNSSISPPSQAATLQPQQGLAPPIFKDYPSFFLNEDNAGRTLSKRHCWCGPYRTSTSFSAPTTRSLEEALELVRWVPRVKLTSAEQTCYCSRLLYVHLCWHQSFKACKATLTSCPLLQLQSNIFTSAVAFCTWISMPFTDTDQSSHKRPPFIGLQCCYPHFTKGDAETHRS